MGGGEKDSSGLAFPDGIDISMAASIVVLPGFVRRRQHETKCEVLARISLSAEGPSDTDGFVLPAPAGLADGENIVIFDHHTMRTTKARDLWLPSTEMCGTRINGLYLARWHDKWDAPD